MSIRRQQPQNRRNRRTRQGPKRSGAMRGLEMPGLLRFLTNPALFLAVGLILAVAIVGSLFAGTFGLGGGGHSGSQQANEAPDVAIGDVVDDGTSASEGVPEVIVKRYDSAPAFTIDPTRSYIATIQTAKGGIRIELYADAAPEAVNVFVFLAGDGYYDNTPFMQVVANEDGSVFTAQAGDPTSTGLGTPGFEVAEEITEKPFIRGAVGMASGQFFISYGDYPSLTGRYTIFGQVVSGFDVLDQLTLLDVNDSEASNWDTVLTIGITES